MAEKAMDVAGKTVDAVNNEEVEDKAKIEEVDVEELNKRFATMEELVGHYREENKTLKSQIQKEKEIRQEAIAARDRLKSKLRGDEDVDDEKGNKNKDIVEYVDSLKKELAKKDEELSNITKLKEKSEKIDIVKKLALEIGLKENYLDELDRFITLDEVEKDKPSTARFQLDAMRTKFPDLFGASGRELEQALPSPKLKTGQPIDHYKKLLAKEKAKGLNANPEELMRLLEIINGDKQA